MHLHGSTEYHKANVKGVEKEPGIVVSREMKMKDLNPFTII